MSSQAEDAFNEDTEVVARMLYARNRTPIEPGWLDQEESIRQQAIKDVRTVVRLYIDATSHCPWCRGTGKPADGRYPDLKCVPCGGSGRLYADHEDHLGSPEASDG